VAAVCGNGVRIFDELERKHIEPFEHQRQRQPDDEQHAEQHDKAFGILRDGNVAFFFGLAYFSFRRFFRF